jgi:CheY-like chemotaxis protein
MRSAGYSKNAKQLSAKRKTSSMTSANTTTTGGWGGATATSQLHQAGGSPEARSQPPIVQLVGDIGHADFRDAIGSLRSDSRLGASVEARPELIVVAQSRPHAFSFDHVKQFQLAAPLAGVVALLGSWCEGETRTGQPWPGIERLYWYEFPAWWRRQLQLRAANRCPDWARPIGQSPRQSEPDRPRPRSGLIVLRTPQRDNADALADVLNHAGHSTAWQRYNRAQAHTRGALAGIWDGGQLSDAETAELAAFCTQMSRDSAPVVALLDFPRRDRVDQAYEAGASAVLGKPYLNADLIAMIEAIAAASHRKRAA